MLNRGAAEAAHGSVSMEPQIVQPDEFDAQMLRYFRLCNLMNYRKLCMVMHRLSYYNHRQRC